MRCVSKLLEVRARHAFTFQVPFLMCSLGSVCHDISFISVVATLLVWGWCRERGASPTRGSSPTRGNVSTNALAGYTKGIQLDKSKEGVSGLPSDRCAQGRCHACEINAKQYFPTLDSFA